MDNNRTLMDLVDHDLEKELAEFLNLIDMNDYGIKTFLETGSMETFEENKHVADRQT